MPARSSARAAPGRSRLTIAVVRRRQTEPVAEAVGQREVVRVDRLDPDRLRAARAAGAVPRPTRTTPARCRAAGRRPRVGAAARSSSSGRPRRRTIPPPTARPRGGDQAAGRGMRPPAGTSATCRRWRRGNRSHRRESAATRPPASHRRRSPPRPLRGSRYRRDIRHLARGHLHQAERDHVDATRRSPRQLGGRNRPDGDTTRGLNQLGEEVRGELDLRSQDPRPVGKRGRDRPTSRTPSLRPRHDPVRRRRAARRPAASRRSRLPSPPSSSARPASRRAPPASRPTPASAAARSSPCSDTCPPEPTAPGPRRSNYRVRSTIPRPPGHPTRAARARQADPASSRRPRQTDPGIERAVHVDRIERAVHVDPDRAGGPR